MNENKIINDILILVASKTGINLEKREKSKILNIIKNRMKSLSLDSMEDYYELFITSEDEFDNFIENILVQETKFMRDPSQFEYLKEVYLPSLIETTSDSIYKKINILSIGCATGQESYSIAFTIEQLSPPEDIKIDITGVDISELAIIKAKKGEYKTFEMRGLNNFLENRYFKRVENENYKIIDSIKEMVKFKKVNIVNEELESVLKSKFNIIFLKNVIFYFELGTISNIMKSVKKILKKDGILILSPSETNMNVIDDDFEEIYFKNIILYKKIR